MPEFVNFGGEQKQCLQKRTERVHRGLGKGVEGEFSFGITCPHCGHNLTPRIRIREGVRELFAEFLLGGSDAAEPIRSSSERQGDRPTFGEGGRELGEDRQVGVQPNAVKPTNSEREQ